MSWETLGKTQLEFDHSDQTPTSGPKLKLKASGLSQPQPRTRISQDLNHFLEFLRIA
jgi:hypothetical protein